jgi:hypothetical protein
MCDTKLIKRRVTLAVFFTNMGRADLPGAEPRLETGTMAQRALLIGSQIMDLAGVDTDVTWMSDALESIGFVTSRCLGSDATRSGILASYERLIADSGGGDAAVVYYSGHGGWAPNPSGTSEAAAGVAPPSAFQFIVPVDIDESTESDFRGILDVELSALLARLTEKTKNASVILDCCHAARMSRDAGMTPKALPRPWVVGIEPHLLALRAAGLPVDRIAPESNPDAVRLVACGPRQSAFEYTTADGRRMGMLTESLVPAIREAAQQRMTWAQLGRHVQRRVLGLAPTQRPEVEGPVDRILFRLESIDRTGVLPVEDQDGVVTLLGGRLVGVDVGDQYLVVPEGVSEADAQRAIATATVRWVDAARAGVDVSYVTSDAPIPKGAQAVPVRKALRRYPVDVAVADAQRAAVASAIAASPHVCVAGDALPDPADLLAQVEVSDGAIRLIDPTGVPLVAEKVADNQGVRETVQNLTALARSRALLELQSGAGESELTTPFTL